MRNRLSTVGMTRTGYFDIVFSGEKFDQRINPHNLIVCSNRYVRNCHPVCSPCESFRTLIQSFRRRQNRPSLACKFR